jgi:hypothetical protein
MLSVDRDQHALVAGGSFLENACFEKFLKTSVSLFFNIGIFCIPMEYSVYQCCSMISIAYEMDPLLIPCARDF